MFKNFLAPPPVGTDPMSQEIALWNSRLLIGFCLFIGALQILVFSFRFFVEGITHPTVFFLLFFGIYLLAQPFLRKFMGHDLLIYSIFFIALLLLPVRIAYTGGLESPVALWLPLLCMIVTITHSSRLGFLFLSLSAASMVGVELLLQKGILPEANQRNFIIDAIVIAGGVLIYSFVIHYFLWEEERSEKLLKDISRKRQEALAENLLLEKNQTILKTVETYNHEYNNPLAIIVLALDRLQVSPGDSELLQKMESAISRMEQLSVKIAAIKKS